MGTRAQFFIGNPEAVESREWLGCVAYDGYVGGDCGEFLSGAKTPESFRAAVKRLAAERDDFTDPEKNSFPFPWANDLFLTDYTYAFFDGRVQVTCFHSGWRDLPETFDPEIAGDGLWEDLAANELPSNVKAPTGSGPKGPDSIMLLKLAK